MRQLLVTFVAVSAVAGLLTSDLRSQSTAGPARIATAERAFSAQATDAAALGALRDWDLQVTLMARDGELRTVFVEDDALVPGRVHERFRQHHRGVRVFGGDIVRQRNGFGQAVSVFGTLYDTSGVNITPSLSSAGAREPLAIAGRGPVTDLSELELVLLPADIAGRSGATLTWTARVLSSESGLVNRIFIDATTGAVAYQYNDSWTQIPPSSTIAPIGSGPGVLGAPQKVPTRADGARFTTVDLWRPGTNSTYDMLGDPVRSRAILSGVTAITDADLAGDTDNAWTAPPVVDGHAFAGLTYDYYRTTFGRLGLDNANRRIRSLVNPALPQNFATQASTYSLFFNNAAYYGAGYIAYGVGQATAGGTVQVRNFAGALDIVAHELTHGVTGYTSGLIYQNESGALNEAYSDIVGVSVEFRVQTRGNGPGLGDWNEGEDVSLSGTPFRSFPSPVTRGHPDHYSTRYTGTADGGGVHINSSIANHAFYLAVEGGAHRFSGVTVTGVGFANREQIERVFFRAFTQLLPSNATFAVARVATIQAARDLYGINSNAERAVTQAWNAVGVQ